MDILALSYNNIWPFFDQTITVPFVQWASLIKAPIGSGKSFLFFDGPLYALYKTSSRQLLSRHAKKWRIHCIFEHNDTIWYVERLITMTKAWNDSAQSRLFQVGISSEWLKKSIEALPSIAYDIDCKSLVESSLDEIEASSQRELEDMLKALLPPRELFLSVHLMMQDADHVFKLPAGQRVTIFKHLFGLLGIDDAKDILFTRRRELQTKLAFIAEKDTSTEKFRKTLQSVYTQKNQCEKWSVWPLAKDRNTIANHTFFKDSSLIVVEDLEIAWFSIWKGLDDDVAVFASRIESVREDLVKKQWAREQNEKQLKALSLQIWDLEQKIATVNRDIQQKDLLLAKKDWWDYELLTKQRDQLHSEKESLLKAWDRSVFESVGKTVSELSEARECINWWINEWKEISITLENGEKEYQTLQQWLHQLQERKKKLDEQLHETEKNYSQQARFECDKIEWPCPYIEVINKAALVTIEQQVVALRKSSEEVATHIEQQEKKLKLVDEENKQRTEKKKKLWGYLQAVWWKSVNETHSKVWVLQKSIDEKSRSLSSLKAQYDQQKVVQQERDTAGVQLQSLNQQSEALKVQRDTLQKELESSHSEPSITLDQLWSAQRSLTSLKEWLHILQWVIDEYSTQQKEKFTMTQELKKVKDLYQIFAKELLVVVLQDFLPQLEEVINAYLIQVVDYQIKFLSPDTVEDAIELNVEVHDSLGVRSVTALSGGQRAVLKICRILAVSSLFRSKLLFLDETITSLDPATVWRVAEMIHEFVRAHNMKFYVVTHAEKIQEMSIWDNIVEIKESK